MVGTGQKFKASQIGLYRCVYNENGCQSDSSAMIILKSVGNAVVANSLLHIFPNPSSTGFYIRNESGLEIHECIIFDVQGRELQGIDIDTMLGYVSTENLMDGTYFMRVAIGEEYQLLRFVVAH